MSEGDARSLVKGLQKVCHCCRGARSPDPMPGVHELSRRIDLEELSFEGEKLSVDLTRSTPTAADTHVTGPLCRAEDAGTDPPVDDLVRGQGSENTLRGSANLHAGQDVALGEVGDRTRPALVGAAHFTSRLRFNRARLDCQNAR